MWPPMGASPPGPVRWTLLGIFLAALVLRVAVTAAFQGLDAPPDRGAFPDQVDYEELAWQLAQGHGYRLGDGAPPTASRAPGTAFALAPVYLVAGRSYLAARLWFCTLSALTVLVVGRFAMRAFGPVAGLLAACLVAFDPQHFYYAMHFRSEAPFTLARALGTLATLRALDAEGRRRRIAWDLVAGASWGFATLCRPQLLLLGPIALVAAALAWRRSGAGALRRVLVQGAVAGLAVLPWMVRNEAVLGTASLTTAGGVTFWGAHNEHVAGGEAIGGWIPIASIPSLLPEDWPPAGGVEAEVERARIAWREGRRFVSKNPGLLPRLTLHKLERGLTPHVGTSNTIVRRSFLVAWYLTLPAAAVGILVAWRRRRDATVVVLLQLGAFLAMVVVFYGHWRFRHATVPMTAILAGCAYASLLEAWWRRRAERAAAR